MQHIYLSLAPNSQHTTCLVPGYMNYAWSVSYVDDTVDPIFTLNMEAGDMTVTTMAVDDKTAWKDIKDHAQATILDVIGQWFFLPTDRSYLQFFFV